jgi:hypothetical protein
MGSVPKQVKGHKYFFLNYLVEFQEEGGRTSLGGHTSWDELKGKEG